MRRPCPPEVDPKAWELTTTLEPKAGGDARAGLASLARHGHPTELDCVVDMAPYRELKATERWGLRKLWSAALAAGWRVRPLPPLARRPPKPRAKRPRPCPNDVDEQAWQLATTLPGQLPADARPALAALAGRGHATHLDCEVQVGVFSDLTESQRWALRRLWRRAKALGLRGREVPPKIRRYEVAHADGVDAATIAFVQARAGADGPLSYEGKCIWYWLHQLVLHDLPTSVDVDLEEGPVRQLWQELFTKAERDLLDMPVDGYQLTRLRRALRTFYTQALKDGLRQRPLPAVIALKRDLRGRTAQLRTLLPTSDRERVERLFEVLDKLSARQQAGRSQRVGRFRDTRAQQTVNNQTHTLNQLLAHARDAQWPVRLDEILVPARVIEFVRRGHREDGSPMSDGEPDRRWRNLYGLLQIAVDLGEPLADREQIERMRNALKEDRQPLNTEGRPRGMRKERKFTPTHDQVRDAIEAIEEGFHRSQVRFQNGQLTARQFHKELQIRTFFHARLRGMWRNDTATTIDLLRARRDLASGVVIVDGVRAKQTGDDHYVEIILLPEMLDYIQELLTFEGRSIDRPLREGERPQLLHAERTESRGGRRNVVQQGDHWGHDRLKNEDIEVAGLWRRDPGRPECLTYTQVTAVSRTILRRIGWTGASPHAFRSAGAIYWRMRGWDYGQIMKLGLWRDLKTLLRCYAELNERDQRTALAALAPSRQVGTPEAQRDRRNAALVRAQRAITDVVMLEDGKLPDFERVASDLRQCLLDIERANASARGKTWVDPRVPRFSEDEEVMLDEALRASYPRGAADVIGRDPFAAARVAEQRRHAAAAAEPSPRLRRLLQRRSALDDGDGLPVGRAGLA